MGALRAEVAASRSSNSSASVEPSPETTFWPPVWLRRMVGTRTSTDMEIPSSVMENGRLVSPPGPAAAGSVTVVDGRVGAVRELVRLHRVGGSDDVDGLFGGLAVGDAERADLGGLGIAGAHEDVVRLGKAHLGGDRDVGARGAGLGGGVGVVRHDDLFVVVPHLVVDALPLFGVE